MKIKRPKSKQPIPKHAKKVFDGVLFDVYQWQQELFDGTKTTFEKLKRADTVTVFPVLDDGKILLTQQEQPGRKPFIGAAGGRVDENENILEAAKRELKEETGYVASEFVLWHAQQPTSKIEWAVYVFIAKGIKRISELNLDAGEKIALKPVSFDELVEIAINDKTFYEKEIVPEFLKAKIFPKKYSQLKDLFSPKNS